MAAGEPEQVRGVYMISVAAELAGMHPQTLRIYEARGLITPKRSPKNTRLYSPEDVRRLKRIQELTGELGMNLAGVERVFELETELDRMQRRVRNLERHAERVERELRGEIERVRRSFKRELVLYEPPPAQAMTASGPHERTVHVPVRRPRAERLTVRTARRTGGGPLAAAAQIRGYSRTTTPPGCTTPRWPGRRIRPRTEWRSGSPEFGSSTGTWWRSTTWSSPSRPTSSSPCWARRGPARPPACA